MHIYVPNNRAPKEGKTDGAEVRNSQFSNSSWRRVLRLQSWIEELKRRQQREDLNNTLGQVALAGMRRATANAHPFHVRMEHSLG